MSSRYLMQSGELDSKGARTAAMIHNSSRQMERLIRDLLDFIRTGLGQDMPIAREETDLLELASQAVEQAKAMQTGREVVLEARGELRGLWDPARIGQVLSNLIGNALKHGDGRMPVLVELSGSDQEVGASVRNDGAPIPKETLARIFEPMWRGPETRARRSDAGLGLGLYIAREIVQAHGGSIDVTSSAEAGTRFSVRLPRHGAPG